VAAQDGGGGQERGPGAAAPSKFLVQNRTEQNAPRLPVCHGRTSEQQLLTPPPAHPTALASKSMSVSFAPGQPHSPVSSSMPCSTSLDGHRWRVTVCLVAGLHEGRRTVKPNQPSRATLSSSARSLGSTLPPRATTPRGPSRRKAPSGSKWSIGCTGTIGQVERVSRSTRFSASAGGGSRAGARKRSQERWMLQRAAASQLYKRAGVAGNQ
jgi:hypothetical protein